MEWKETVASQCRWSEYAEKNWADWNFIWEDSEADYQGHASFLATKDGKFVYVSWNYGSCSGCDSWEDMEEEVREQEFKDTATYFDDVHELKAFVDTVNYGKEFKDAVATYMFHALLEKELAN